jgi:hypothetical protein
MRDYVGDLRGREGGEAVRRIRDNAVNRTRVERPELLKGVTVNNQNAPQSSSFLIKKRLKQALQNVSFVALLLCLFENKGVIV